MPITFGLLLARYIISSIMRDSVIIVYDMSILSPYYTLLIIIHTIIHYALLLIYYYWLLWLHYTLSLSPSATPFCHAGLSSRLIVYLPCRCRYADARGVYAVMMRCCVYAAVILFICYYALAMLFAVTLLAILCRCVLSVRYYLRHCCSILITSFDIKSYSMLLIKMSLLLLRY